MKEYNPVFSNTAKDFQRLAVIIKRNDDYEVN